MDLGVNEAASRLGVHPSRVRQLLHAGDLGGRQISGVWLISANDVARRASRRSQPGRPLAPARAWGLLDLLDHGSAPWLSPVARSQVRQVLRGISGADADRWRAVLRARSEVHPSRAHPAALRRLLDTPGVRASGSIDVAGHGIDLVVVNALPEVYVTASEWPQLARSLHLVTVHTGVPDVVVRVPRIPLAFAHRLSLGAAAVAADLMDSDEPRAVVAGAAKLNELSRQLLPTGQ